MPRQQKQTEVDMHGEDYSKEEKREQKKQLKAAWHALTYNPPVNERLVAQQYSGQASGSGKTMNYGGATSCHQTVNYQPANNYQAEYGQGFTIIDDAANYFDPIGQNDFITGIDAATTARNYAMDTTMNNMVDIVDGKKKKKEKGKKSNM